MLNLFGQQLDLKKIKMCGINGFYSKSLSTFNNIIVKMNLAISHRGPDSSGVWSDKNSGIVFGHQRLSIIDLSKAGNQPMQSNSGRLILTYNGEIYNHLEIRNELEKNNFKIKWRSCSDTETLLEAIDFWGLETTLKKLMVCLLLDFGIKNTLPYISKRSCWRKTTLLWLARRG